MLIRILIILYFIVSSSFIFAEDEDEKLNVTEEIIVTATRSEQNIINTPSSIKVISAADIKTSGALHVVDVLRNQGGVQISDLFGDGSRTTVSVRGFGGNAQANTLIMVDGRRLNNADLGNPDLNSISINSIERIEILRGSAGVLFGDQAVGGVINIITKRPDIFNVNVGGHYGSYNNRGANMSVSDRFENGVGYQFIGVKNKADNYRDNNDLSLTNIFGLVEYQHDYGKLFFEYQDIDEDLELPGALFIDQVNADRKQAFNPLDFIDTDTQIFRLGITQSLWHGWELLTEYTNRRADAEGLLSVGGVPGPVLTKRDHRELTPRLTGSFDMSHGPALLILGADLFSTEFFLSSILGTIDNDQNQYAVYGRGIIPVAERLTLTIGARYANVDNDIVGGLLPLGTNIDDDATAFEAGLSFQIDSNTRLFGRVDTNYRFVLADEYTSASFAFPVLVIPDTQTGESYEFGYEWSDRNANASLVFYRLDVNDEIAFDPLRFINTNIGDTRRTGFITDANYSPIDQLNLGFNFSYVNADVVEGPLTGLDIPFVAEHTFNLYSSYQFTQHLSGYFEVLGISERTTVGDFFNTVQSLAGHVTTNLNLSYNRGPISAGFKINNILDTEYRDNAQIGFGPAPTFIPETTFFPAPERNFLFTLSYNYD